MTLKRVTELKPTRVVLTILLVWRRERWVMGTSEKGRVRNECAYLH